VPISFYEGDLLQVLHSVQGHCDPEVTELDFERVERGTRCEEIHDDFMCPRFIFFFWRPPILRG